MKRRFKEGVEKEGHALVSKMRTRAMDQKGYISGETLINNDDAQKTMVIGTWQRMEDPRRKDCEERLEKLLAEPREYETYGYRYRLERMMAVK
jgi:hypothetical protein